MSGPSKDTLKFIRGMLPSLVEGVQTKQAIGRGIRSPIVRKPTKTCTYCTTLYGHVAMKVDDAPKLEIGICPDCQAKLDDGYIAIIAPNRLCFIKSKSLKDMAGKEIRVSGEAFAKIEAEYKANWQSDDNKPQPSKPT